MTNWLSVLDEQSIIAFRMTQKVPAALIDKNLTLDMASRIGDLVKRGARDFYELMDKMEHADDPKCASLMHSAKRIEGLWDGLSRMTAARLYALQGIMPVKQAA